MGRKDQEKRKTQVLVTALTAEGGGKTASCSGVMAHLHSGLTKPARLGTFHRVSKEEARCICQPLVKKFTPWDANSLALQTVIQPPPVVVGEDRVRDATPLRV